VLALGLRRALRRRGVLGGRTEQIRLAVRCGDVGVAIRSGEGTPSGSGASFFAGASSRARLARRFVRQDFGVALAGEVELGALCFACRRLRMIARASFTCCTCDFFGGGFMMKDCPLVMDAVSPFVARPDPPVSLIASGGPIKRRSS